MTELRNYLGSRQSLRITLLIAGLIVASVFLYMAITAYLFIQYSDLMVIVLLLGTIGFDVGIAWLLQQKSSRGFWLNVVLSSVAVAVGSILVSMVIWHGHWAITIRELLKEPR